MEIVGYIQADELTTLIGARCRRGSGEHLITRAARRLGDLRDGSRIGATRGNHPRSE
jgi:hypothetical protein